MLRHMASMVVTFRFSARGGNGSWNDDMSVNWQGGRRGVRVFAKVDLTE